MSKVEPALSARARKSGVACIDFRDSPELGARTEYQDLSQPRAAQFRYGEFVNAEDQACLVPRTPFRGSADRLVCQVVPTLLPNPA
jgi:hypothetical protein